MANGLQGSATILKNLAYNPVAQLDLARAEQQDKRAISGRDQMLGKMVAGEQKRQLALEEAGERLAMRKDRLAFAKKVQSEQMGLAKDKMAFEKSQRGIEMGLGLASVAATGYGSYRKAQQDKAYREEKLELLSWMREQAGITAINNAEPTEEELRFIDYK